MGGNGNRDPFMTARILLVIPARYASVRLPGKPLVKIAGVEMIRRVADIAASVCRRNPESEYVVATDDDRILSFCQARDVPAVMTSDTCRSGTERCREVVERYEQKPEFVVNLQGDNPLCPPWVIQQLIDVCRDERADVYTPCIRLSWEEYERLAETKKSTPYSGTTVLVDRAGYALAFSKNIIPAVRRPEKAREQMPRSPVRRHVGLYAYTTQALQAVCTMPESPYELSYIEGLEQMRFLYNGLRVRVVDTDYCGRKTTAGVDSPEDVARVEEILREFGEFDLN